MSVLQTPAAASVDPRGPSDRKFGLVMGALAGAVAGWLAWRGHGMTLVAAIGAISVLLLGSAWLLPGWLGGLNRAWMRLGELLARVVNPVVLGILFFGIITPAAWLARLTGRDPLRLKPRKAAASYWVPRESPGPDPASFRNQF